MQPRDIKNIIPLFLVVLLCSCGSVYTNHYFLVNNHGKRTNSFGFSITPPSGIGWYEKLNKKSLYYLKKTDLATHVIYTKATEIHLQPQMLDKRKFMQFVTDYKKINTQKGNIKNITFRLVPYTLLSPFCVRYVQKYEDHGRGGKNTNRYNKVTNRGLVCMHPDAPLNGVDMYYAEITRYSPQKKYKSYQDEGEKFLNSLTFF